MVHHIVAVPILNCITLTSLSWSLTCFLGFLCFLFLALSVLDPYITKIIVSQLSAYSDNLWPPLDRPDLLVMIRFIIHHTCNKRRRDQSQLSLSHTPSYIRFSRKIIQYIPSCYASLWLLSLWCNADVWFVSFPGTESDQPTSGTFFIFSEGQITSQPLVIFYIFSEGQVTSQPLVTFYIFSEGRSRA